MREVHSGCTPTLGALLCAAERESMRIRVAAVLLMHAIVQVFIINFFADSPAVNEWRVLSSYLLELEEKVGVVMTTVHWVRCISSGAERAEGSKCTGSRHRL